MPHQVYIYDPRMENRVVGLLQTGAVMGRVFPTYESHIPYLLQFLIDYNIYGMNMINVAEVRFRGPFAHNADLATPPPVVSAHTQGGSTVAGTVWSLPDLPDHLRLGAFAKRQSTTALEV